MFEIKYQKLIIVIIGAIIAVLLILMNHIDVTKINPISFGEEVYCADLCDIENTEWESYLCAPSSAATPCMLEFAITEDKGPTTDCKSPMTCCCARPFHPK